MYRVQVVHADPEHPNAKPAHVGPAFDESFVELAKHFKDGDIDLLEEARSFRDRCRAEVEEGYSYDVVELVTTEGAEDAWEIVEDPA